MRRSLVGVIAVPRLNVKPCPIIWRSLIGRAIVDSSRTPVGAFCPKSFRCSIGFRASALPTSSSAAKSWILDSSAKPRTYERLKPAAISSARRYAMDGVT